MKDEKKSPVKKEKTPSEILTEILKEYPSMRVFGKHIGEDSADVARWKTGKKKIKARAVISICRLHPKTKPYQLNPILFPKNLHFIFNKTPKQQGENSE